MPQPTGTIPKVRGYIRSESRVKALGSPTGYKQLTSEVDREANDNVTLTGSALMGDVVVSSVIDNEGGVAVSIVHKGKRVLLVSVPTLDASEAGMQTTIQTGDIAAKLLALPRD